jgi:hypothetical protein
MPEQDRREGENEAIRKRIDELQAAYETFIASTDATLARFSKRVYRLLAFLIVVMFACGYISIKADNSSSSNASRAKKLASQNNQLALKSSALALDIQMQRRQSIYDNCNDQNKRNANTIKALGVVATQAEKSDPSQATQIKSQIKSNVLLIDALVPTGDCTAEVLKQTGKPLASSSATKTKTTTTSTTKSTTTN